MHLPGVNARGYLDEISGGANLRSEREGSVILVVTDERGCETVFGFARFASILLDTNMRPVMKTPIGNRWFLRDFVDSSDERYREIVRLFLEGGSLDEDA